LTNNNANIRRMKERIASLEMARAQKSTEASGENGIRIEDSVEDNRLRIFFPGKPDGKTIASLKLRGFKWSPSVGAWQRFRSPEATRIAEQITGLKMPEQKPEATKFSLSQPTQGRFTREQIDKMPESKDENENAALQRVSEDIRRSGKDFSATAIARNGIPFQPETMEGNALSELEQVFGKKVVFFRTPEGATFDPNGFRNERAKDYIFVNVNDSNPFLTTIGHELTHEMRKDDDAGLDRTATRALSAVRSSPGEYKNLMSWTKTNYGDQYLSDLSDHENAARVLAGIEKRPENLRGVASVAFQRFKTAMARPESEGTVEAVEPVSEPARVKEMDESIAEVGEAPETARAIPEQAPEVSGTSWRDVRLDPDKAFSIREETAYKTEQDFLNDYRDNGNHDANETAEEFLKRRFCGGFK